MSNLAIKRKQIAYTLEDPLGQYLTIKSQIEALEHALNAFRVGLESAVEQSDGTLELDGYKLKLIDCTRENFSLKEARRHIDIEILKPYISVSQYKQLRVTAKKAA